MKTVRLTCTAERLAALESHGGTRATRADLLVQELTGLSRSATRGLFDHGCVRVNDVSVTKPQQRLHTGDCIAVSYDPSRRYKPKPMPNRDSAFELLHEDDHLVVVNKSPHVFTVPTPREKGKTLLEAVERHVNGRQSARSPRQVVVVHRLDRGVSGVLVFAKERRVAADLMKQFAAHTPRRLYVAIVHGHLNSQKGTFRSHMATGRTLKRYSTRNPSRGELAITHYEVTGHARGASMVRVQLETGRRNQIRVHFAEAGHPVLGDRRYRPDLASHPHWKAKRLALHAASLEFVHPITGRSMKFQTPLPREFEPWVHP